MAASKQVIRQWFREGVGGATHMIIVADGFDWTDYPVYVKEGEDPRKIAEKYDGKDMQKIMEVYNLSKDMEEQIAKHRVFNYD